MRKNIQKKYKSNRSILVNEQTGKFENVDYLDNGNCSLTLLLCVCVCVHVFVCLHICWLKESLILNTECFICTMFVNLMELFMLFFFLSLKSDSIRFDLIGSSLSFMSNQLLILTPCLGHTDTQQHIQSTWLISYSPTFLSIRRKKPTLVTPNQLDDHCFSVQKQTEIR